MWYFCHSPNELEVNGILFVVLKGAKCKIADWWVSFPGRKYWHFGLVPSPTCQPKVPVLDDLEWDSRINYLTHCTTQSMNMLICFLKKAGHKMSRPSLKSPLSMLSLHITLVLVAYRKTCCDVTKSCSYEHVLKSHLKWAQRNFRPSADECENSLLMSTSVHPSFCTVELKQNKT